MHIAHGSREEGVQRRGRPRRARAYSAAAATQLSYAEKGAHQARPQRRPRGLAAVARRRRPPRRTARRAARAGGRAATTEGRRVAAPPPLPPPRTRRPRPPEPASLPAGTTSRARRRRRRPRGGDDRRGVGVRQALRGSTPSAARVRSRRSARRTLDAAHLARSPLKAWAGCIRGWRRRRSSGAPAPRAATRAKPPVRCEGGKGRADRQNKNCETSCRLAPPSHLVHSHLWAQKSEEIRQDAPVSALASTLQPRAACSGDVFRGARQRRCRSLTADPISTPNTGTSCCAEYRETAEQLRERRANGRPRVWQPPGRRSLAPQRLPTRSWREDRAHRARQIRLADILRGDVLVLRPDGRSSERVSCASAGRRVGKDWLTVGVGKTWPDGLWRRAVDLDRLESC